MKYEYITATGKVAIEVDEHFYQILIRLDKEQFNSERKHRRRYPLSLEDMEYAGRQFSNKEDFLDEIIVNETVQNALHCLSKRQRYLIEKICLEGWRYTELAFLEGKDESAVRHAAGRAKKRLRNYFYRPSDIAVSRGYTVRERKSA